MDKANSVEVKSMSKQFTVKYTTFYGGLAKSGTKSVLRGLSFNLKKGEVLGIVGKNGSGKSTLLKILSDIMNPDEGSISIDGKVASILELGMGFNPESSGRDNIRIKCSLYGMRDAEISDAMEDIVLFSELGEQIDHPLRTYSSGMVAKLAFAVLIHVKCDVLIIDEVLSVGDAGFNSKCRLAFENMRKSKKSIIMASHNLETLKDMCDRVMWIDEGECKEIGDPVTVCYHYESDLVDSFDTVMSRALAGDLVSLNRAAVMLRDGNGVDADSAKSIELFKKAADMGYADSQVELANILLMEGDRDGARELYAKASAAGSTVATSCLMTMDLDSDISEEFAKAVRAKAETGNIRAMKLLADMYYNGVAVVRDRNEAFLWYLRSAQGGNAQSQFIVGTCYRDGIGIAKDAKKAVEWLSRSSNHGNIRACTELANMYRKGMGVDRDMKMCVEWFEEAARRGDSNSMNQLGTMFRDGAGVEKDKSMSDFWFTMFARQGRIGYEATFGDILRQSSVGQSQAACVKWYADASSRGSIPASNALGQCYRDGGFVPADSSKAVEAYSISAGMMNPMGMYELAMLKLKGNGTPRDLSGAFDLMRRSADCGNMNAMLQVSQMYRDGVGTEVDIDMASHYLGLLSEMGNTGAMQMLSDLNRRSPFLCFPANNINA